MQGTRMQAVYHLQNPIMPYAWGSRTALAELLDSPRAADTPQAELWMSAHPRAPSLVVAAGKPVSLIDAIDQDPEGMLGAAVARRFDRRLPYLFKVLAVDRPLSIQAHPDRPQARAGFLRENNHHISMDAPERNYRDASHKPELICALTDFDALSGFRPVAEIMAFMRMACPRSLAAEIDWLAGQNDADGPGRFLKMLLSLPSAARKAAVAEAAVRSAAGKVPPPAGDWVGRLADAYPHDAGVLAPLFMHLIRLTPGQALYIPAGRLHAYLRGTGIELMANSDNVLRGGLTGKHVDVAELTAILETGASPVHPFEPQRVDAVESVYPAPAAEFVLSRIMPGPGRRYTARPETGARIILCTEGRAVVTVPATGETLTLRKGRSVFVAGSIGSYTLTGRGVFYQAATPA